MDTNQITNFENLCNIMYGPNSTNENRQKASEELTVITSRPDFMNLSQQILEKSTNLYALSIVGTSLTRLLTQYWNNFSEESRFAIRDYVLNYLTANGTQISPSVRLSLISLVCRITKLSWLTDTRQRNLLDIINDYLNKDVPYALLGLQFFSELVTQFNIPTSNNERNEHRRASALFRDASLINVIKIAFNILERINSNAIQYDNTNQQQNLLLAALTLLLKCLTYDFTGVTPDETSEEVGTVQIPVKWENYMANTNLLTLLFDLYPKCFPPTTVTCLNCLLLMTSMRRSLFYRQENRLSFLNVLIHGSISILNTKYGFDDPDTYHMFCQVLGKLKANFQLSEIFRTDEYSEFIRLVTVFTNDSFCNWQWCSNSISYLLTLWSRLICAERYVQTSSDMSESSYFNQCVPMLVQAYIKGRLETVEEYLDDNENNPLSDIESLTIEMQQLPQIVRFCYETNSKYICECFDPLNEEYQTLLRQQNTILPSSPQYEAYQKQMKIVEARLAWLCNIMGTVISGQNFLQVQIDRHYEQYDGDLCRRVLQLAVASNYKLTNTNGESKIDPNLELALLSFFEQFRKTFITDTNPANLELHDDEFISARNNAKRHFFNSLSIGDYSSVLNYLMEILLNNLKYWSENNLIIKNSLNTFLNLTSDYTCSRILLTLQTTQYLLQKHTEDVFSFLRQPNYDRYRTLYYTALSTLLFIEDIPGHLNDFMVPILNNMQTVCEGNLSDEPIQTMFINIFRDLRGILNGCTEKFNFTSVFNIISKPFFEVVKKGITEQPANVQLLIPMFKCISTLVLNRNSRIDISSDCPVLIYINITAIMNQYVTTVLNLITQNPYINGDVYKLLSNVFYIYARLLGGKYISHGIFVGYNDTSLYTCTNNYINLILAVQKDRLFSFPKACRAVYTLLNVLVSNYIEVIADIPNDTFLTLLTLLTQGTNSFDTEIVKESTLTVNSLCTYIYLNHYNNKDVVDKLLQHMNSSPTFWNSLFESLFNSLLFGDTPTHCQIAVTLLTLYLIKKEVLEAYKQTLFQSQQGMPDNIPKLTNAFNLLFSNITYSLSRENKDLFTKKCIAFKETVMKFLVI